MKRFFEEHTSVVIICIVISLILCIIGCINNIDNNGTITGKGLLKVVGDNLTDTIDTYQKQIIPNKNLISNSKGPFIKKSRNAGDDYDNYQHLAFPAEIDNNKSYTFSANVEAIGNYDEFSVMFLKIFDDGTDTALYNKQFIKIPNNHNNRIKITLKNTDLSRDFNAVAVYSGIQGYTRGQGIKVWNVKLEEGTKATPYEE